MILCNWRVGIERSTQFLGTLQWTKKNRTSQRIMISILKRDIYLFYVIWLLFFLSPGLYTVMMFSYTCCQPQLEGRVYIALTPTPAEKKIHTFPNAIYAKGNVTTSTRIRNRLAVFASRNANRSTMCTFKIKY